MRANTERAQDVPAVELSRWQKIQGSGKQSHPGGSSYRMQQHRVTTAPPRDEISSHRICKNQRHSKNHIGIAGIGETGNNLGVADTP